MKPLPALLVLVMSLFSRVALAEPPASEEDAYPVIEDPRKLELDPLMSAPGALWLSIEGALRVDDSASHATGMIVLGGDIDDIVKGPSHRFAAERAKSAPSIKEEMKLDGQKPAAADARVRAAGATRGALARGAVRAALAAAGSKKVAARLDDTSTRARLSGLVPEVRVRIAHVMDEGQALAPTEYDPERVTATGGTSLWLEGRATFRFDRLVFADDEVAIERLRAERAKLERDLTDEVLKAFGDWQRGLALMASETAEPDAKDKAEIDSAVAEARLDALTDGWFGAAAAKAQNKDAKVCAVSEDPTH